MRDVGDRRALALPGAMQLMSIAEGLVETFCRHQVSSLGATAGTPGVMVLLAMIIRIAPCGVLRRLGPMREPHTRRSRIGARSNPRPGIAQTDGWRMIGHCEVVASDVAKCAAGLWVRRGDRASEAAFCHQEIEI